MVKNKYINFALSNIRQSRGKIIAIAFLFIIASALINTALFLSMDYKQNFMREKQRLNGEDIDFLFADLSPAADQKEALADIFRGNEDIREFEIDECFAGKGSVDFLDASVFTGLSFLRFEDAENKSIGEYEILESDGGGGAYLSYVFKAEAGYSTGDTISVKIGSKSETFRIAGFYHNVDTGTINCSDTVFLLTDDCWRGLSGLGLPSYRVSACLHDTDRADMIESAVCDEVADALPALTLIASSSINKLASARYITTTIIEAIITVSAVLIVAIVLAIIAITLSGYIRSSIKNLGILKAIGYRSNALIISIVFEFLIISLVMSVIGIAASYALLPVINSAMESQSGIPYQIHFIPAGALATVGICVGTAVLSSLLSVLKIRRILPVNAIRDSQSSKKNVSKFALDKTHFSLNTAIALKTWLSGKMRSIIVFLTITGVAFLIGFVCSSYQNIIRDDENVLKLVCGQLTDSAVDVSVLNEAALKKELSGNEVVDKFYMFNVCVVAPNDMPKMYAYIIESAEHIDEDRVCISGRLPSADDEIAVNGAYAEQNGLAVGDKLRFEHDGELCEFIVTGITQGAYSSGRDCYLTRDGYTGFSLLKDVCYYVDLKEGVDVDEFNSSIGENCDLMYAMNFRKNMETSSKTYLSILKIATVTVAVISLAVTAFVLYVLLSLLLSNKKREHAVFKALGFTSSDIIYQTVVSLLPTCVIAVITGLWISRTGAGFLLTLALSGIGIFSFGTPTKLLYLVGAGAALIIFITVYMVLLSNSVKNITPHKLFVNE